MTARELSHQPHLLEANWLVEVPQASIQVRKVTSFIHNDWGHAAAQADPGMQNHWREPRLNAAWDSPRSVIFASVQATAAHLASTRAFQMSALASGRIAELKAARFWVPPSDGSLLVFTIRPFEAYP